MHGIIKRMVLCVIFAVFAAIAAQGQVNFIDDDFSSAFGTTSPNWSVILLSGNDNGVGNWRYDNIGNRAITAPITIPFAMSDSDAAGVTAFSSSLQSIVVDVSGATQVLLEFDYMFRQLGAVATVEAFDGSTWNNVSTLAENDMGGGTNSHVNFDVTAIIGGSTNSRIRFVHTGNFDWWYGVDNIKLYTPPATDIGWKLITAPVSDSKDCTSFFSAAEPVSISYINSGSTILPTGTAVSLTVELDGVTLITEVDVLIAPLAPGGCKSYTTLGTLDLSPTGGGSRKVHLILCTPGDSNSSNDRCSYLVKNPGHIAEPPGWQEDFDSLASNNGAFAMTVFDVPPSWENAEDDGASLALNIAPNWGPNSGTTGSNQGPQSDHTTGSSGGIYMYIEDSPSESGSIELRSPCLDLSGSFLGVPALQFFHFSHATPGVSDNILDVDIINETTGGTVTMSVYSQGGFGDNDWHVANLDLSAFAPDFVKAQWRTSNDNQNFTDDVAIDDVSFLDLFLPVGQGPQVGNAVFDINNSLNSLGQSVSSFANGPYSTNVAVGSSVNLSWSGQANSVMICLFGPPNDGVATFPPPTGQLDIGTLPLSVLGLPGSIFVFGNGNLFASSFFHAHFFTGPAGNGGVGFILSQLFVPGFLTRFQCVMNPAGTFFLSNAVDVTVI
ncbi:MAG: hypothetical protein ACI97A_002893 [Planctomycetota bacterium]|jgi:hypothetical protein